MSGEKFAGREKNSGRQVLEVGAQLIVGSFRSTTINGKPRRSARRCWVARARRRRFFAPG